MLAFCFTGCRACCIYCRIHNFFVSCRNFCLSYKDLITYGAMLAFRFTGCRTRCFYCRIHNFFVSCKGCILLSYEDLITYGAMLAFRFTGCYACCFYSFIYNFRMFVILTDESDFFTCNSKVGRNGFQVTVFIKFADHDAASGFRNLNFYVFKISFRHLKSKKRYRTRFGHNTRRQYVSGGNKRKTEFTVNSAINVKLIFRKSFGSFIGNEFKSFFIIGDIEFTCGKTGILSKVYFYCYRISRLYIGGISLQCKSNGIVSSKYCHRECQYEN